MKNKYLLMAAWAMIIMVIYSIVSPVAGAVSLALVGGNFNEDMTLWRQGITQKMNFVTWDKGFWYKYMGFIGGRKSMFDENFNFGNVNQFKKEKATGQPIEVYQEFKTEVSSKLQIPTVYPLVGLGKSGSETLVGNSERPKLTVQEVGVNQKRHAYLEQDSKMSKQLLTHLPRLKQLFKRSGDYLGDWFGRWLAYQPYLALLEGYSENLSASAGGTSVTKRSHMNLYVANVGRVAFSTTHATYEAAVASALGGMTDTSPYWFSTDMIENMVYEAAHTHKILPLDIEGMSLYPIIIKDSQAKQLQKDTKWNDRMKYAAERNLRSNPLFSGNLVGIYGGAIIHIDTRIPSARITGDADFSAARSTVTGDTTGVCYGTEDAAGLPDFMEVERDSGPLTPAILFGKSAILCGVVSDISFETEEYDFKQKVEVGADMIIGFQNADILDRDGHFGTAGNYRYDNRSSLIAFSYSPTTAVW